MTMVHCTLCRWQGDRPQAWSYPCPRCRCEHIARGPAPPPDPFIKALVDDAIRRYPQVLAELAKGPEDSDLAADSFATDAELDALERGD